jgi:hypothetical protein
MVSEHHSVHTILDPMADSSDSHVSANIPIPSPTPVQSHIAPLMTENTTASLTMPNIHSHIAPKVQLDVLVFYIDYILDKTKTLYVMVAF